MIGRIWALGNVNAERIVVVGVVPDVNDLSDKDWVLCVCRKECLQLETPI